MITHVDGMWIAWNSQEFLIWKFLSPYLVHFTIWITWSSRSEKPLTANFPLELVWPWSGIGCGWQELKTKALAELFQFYRHSLESLERHGRRNDKECRFQWSLQSFSMAVMAAKGLLSAGAYFCHVANLALEQKQSLLLCQPPLLQPHDSL